MVDTQPTNRIKHLVYQEERKTRFTSLFNAHKRGLFTYLLALTGDFTAAEDALQEASIVMWQKFPEFQEGTNFAAWARKIACNMGLRSRKEASKRLPIFSSRFLDAIAEASMASEEHRDRRGKALASCVLKLSQSDRELLTHRYGNEGLTAKDVAKTLNRPANTVYKALRRIRASLLECVRRTIAREDQP
ncbi:MAG: sigma-70 family RNA polymerase sigma factor [Pirellulales bacterium]|nr:sigma-70 family RNA polymerase sigma factor [Pirellulales bacterium]